MKDEKCECFSNTSECTENDCEGCPARLESEAEIRAKAIEEFAEVLKEKLRKKQKQTWLVLAERNGYARSIDLIDEISTELKGE